MSPPRDPREFRGARLTAGYTTLDQALALAGFAGRNAITVRRHLHPARAGRWLDQGARHWRVVYDEKQVRAVAEALAAGTPNPLRAPRAPNSPTPDRPPSAVPTGVPVGWATVEQLWEALRDLGVETDRVTQRYLRARLHALRVPSERRVVTRPIECVFPREEALRKLQADPKFVRQANGIRWWDLIPAKIEQRRKAHESGGK